MIILGLQPKIQKSKSFIAKTCTKCGGTFGPESFIKTKSFFYPDGYLPLCVDCIKEYLIYNEFNWSAVDRLCQYTDIPFVPKEFERLREMNGDNVFPIYAELFLSNQYEGLGWDDYFKAFKDLKEIGNIEDELPGLREEKFKKLRERWGANYDEEALVYLESLFKGLLATQNVNGALQIDQALKICKMSFEIDNRIREGSDFDKILGSYDKLVKTAEFTPKNVKNINDFDTCGELVKWLEKKGWKNRFYDNVTRDIVDESIKNFQNFNQRLYTNESGIDDEITRRIEALRSTKEMENYYTGSQTYDDLEDYDNEGYTELFREDEEFSVELGGNNE